MPRWSDREQSCVDEVRKRVANLIDESPPYPEVVGDRKIIRFLRGHDYNLDKVCTLYGKFLQWRKDNCINEIRKQIVEGGSDHPLKFPKGEIIIAQIPQLVLAPDALDNLGSPVVVEQYNFSPSEAIKHFSIADYILYMTYCLEYRSILLEQISEEREQAFLQTLTDEERKRLHTSECTLAPYGVIATTCIIRDLKGVGFEHLGSKGIEIISAVVTLASDNYPELMRKCYMINSPWIFNTAWYVIKQLLAPRTIAKISVMGSNYEEEINGEIPRASLPKLVGGPYIGYAEYVSYAFNRVYLSPSHTHSLSTPTASASIEGEKREEEPAESNAVIEEHLHHLLPIEEVTTFDTAMKQNDYVEYDDIESGEKEPAAALTETAPVADTVVVDNGQPAAVINPVLEANTIPVATKNSSTIVRSNSPENQGFDFCLISLTTSGY